MRDVCVDVDQLSRVTDDLGRLFEIFNQVQGKLAKSKDEFSRANRDAKSKEILNVIMDCQQSIKIAQRELYSCHKTLAKLNEIAAEYDSISFERDVLVGIGSTVIGGAINTINRVTQLNRDPSVRRAVNNFAEAVSPIVVDMSERLMEQVHATYDTPEARFIREHPFRDEDGNIV